MPFRSKDGATTPPETPPVSAPASGTSTPKTTSSANGDLMKNLTPDGKVPDDSSKIRTVLSILKKFIGVTDIAAVRFSLPAQLLEPIPNLEYWHYLDRPEAFISIGDSEDELERMLACLRFWFVKDLKYVKGKPCKPYNSTLGEFFRCQWKVVTAAPPQQNNVEEKAGAEGTAIEAQTVQVNYLTEQTSHHPPVSAFYIDCPERGISARGYDQLSAKFTGTSVRVIPGVFNEGIFITLERRDNEEYQLTHPAAYLCGFLRGSPYIAVADTCFVTCPKTGIKVLLHYVDESYFGKTKNKIEGIVYKCDVAKDKASKVDDVPEKDILGRIDGCWTDKVYFSYGSTDFRKVPEKDRILMADLGPLSPAPKICPPADDQLPNESRRFWAEVTDAIKAKQFSLATAKKTELEELQRQRASERKAVGKEWHPRFFAGVTEPPGRPELSAEGKQVLEGMGQEQWHLEEPKEYGAM